MRDEEIKENLEKVLFEIREAERKSGRKENSVALCAVSKFHPAEDVLSCMAAGQLIFGENRVQEATEKFSAIQGAQLHIIGSLQSNKAKKAVEIASCIQSVDRISLMEELEKQCSRLEKNINIFLEIHTGEDSKSGFKDQKELFDSLEKLCTNQFPHLTCTGLMTMAPFVEDEKLIHSSFQSLRNLKEQINREFSQLPVRELSMGMSGDFKIAIEEGSTMVRVGTAIFGQRDYGTK